MARLSPTLPIGRPAFALNAADGATELAIGTAAGGRGSRPERVTAVLAAALATVDGVQATGERVRELSSGTREWLLQQVGALFRPRQDWFEGRCPGCGHAYDLQVQLGELPVKPEGRGFPVVRVITSLGPRVFDVPNGADEERLARQGGGDRRRQLLALCGHADTAVSEAERFTEADIGRIDAALDEVAMQPADHTHVTCPECGLESDARIDPTAFAFPHEASVLGEVHRIAAAYHWGEDQILRLPSRRRRQYLGLIRADKAGRRR